MPHGNWVWKGVAAQMLVKYADLTRRDCAVFIGVKGGMPVNYQMRQAEEKIKSDVKLSKIVSQLGLRLYEESHK